MYLFWRAVEIKANNYALSLWMYSLWDSTENKAGYVDVIYGCASQTASKFDSLMENFEKSLYHI